MKTRIGITFSHPHLEHLRLNIKDALQKAFSFHFSHIRLGAYWSEIEKSDGIYDYSKLQSILDQCEKADQPVVLTVGVKAPRWPEFFWPGFITRKESNNPATAEKILRFVENTVKTARSFTCITHWQVENEPLDPSGPENKVIEYGLLKQEIDAVRRLDKRPVLLNIWGNDLVSRGLFPRIEELADVVGLELYYRQYLKSIFGKHIYAGPRQSHEDLKSLLKKSSKQIWITELQAEPWEKDEQAYLSANPGSMSPRQLEKNVATVSDLPVEEIHLWGFEYWLWREKQGDSRYLDVVSRLCRRRTSA